MDILTIDKLLNKKDELLYKLYAYYEKKDGKKKDWESQIRRSRYKSKCQS